MLYFGTGHEIKVREKNSYGGAFRLFSAARIFLIGSVLTSRLILGRDSIELKYLVSSKLLRRSDIAGSACFRRSTFPAGLAAQVRRAEKTQNPAVFPDRRGVPDWFIDISNLDREDLQKSQAELEAAATTVDSPAMETS